MLILTWFREPALIGDMGQKKYLKCHAPPPDVLFGPGFIVGVSWDVVNIARVAVLIDSSLAW